MQRALQSMLSSVLRSRWMLAVALMVAIVAIVALARVLAGPAPDRILDTGSPVPSISIDPHGDDGITSAEPPPAPVVEPGSASPEAVAYAFASAWADHEDISAKDWHDRLLPHVTESLADRLAKTDPVVIPAERVLDKPTLTPIGEQLVEAKIKTNAGELQLGLVAPDGRWLVDTVGWQRA